MASTGLGKVHRKLAHIDDDELYMSYAHLLEKGRKMLGSLIEYFMWVIPVFPINRGPLEDKMENSTAFCI